MLLINTLRLGGIHLLDGGRQVVCLPRATLYSLENKLRRLRREPHSVIGSSCVGASVVGGVCNNSGGSLVSRGPAYTELALFARQEADGRLVLVNHLGIVLGDEPEAILARLEAGKFDPADVIHDPVRVASDHDYPMHVRAINESTPARFNADPTRLFEASGSAGKVALFAVRLDTFPTEPETTTFYIGTNDTAELTRLRRDMLSAFDNLPIAAEYIHCEAFDVAADYGKDTVLAIERLGTEALPRMFAAKARVDSLVRRGPFLPDNLSEIALQAVGGLFRDHLPARMRDYRDRYEHHLLLKMDGAGGGEALAYLAQHFPSSQGEH